METGLYIRKGAEPMMQRARVLRHSVSREVEQLELVSARLADAAVTDLSTDRLHMLSVLMATFPRVAMDVVGTAQSPSSAAMAFDRAIGDSECAVSMVCVEAVRALHDMPALQRLAAVEYMRRAGMVDVSYQVVGN